MAYVTYDKAKWHWGAKNAPTDIPQIMGNLEGNKTPFIQPLAAAINCTIWTSYGLLKAKKDYPLSAANLPGIIFGLLATITAF